MNRYRATFPRDEPLASDGDNGFIGVDMRQGQLDPSALPERVCAAARNKRFTRGIAETRKGLVKMAWSSLSGDTITPYKKPWGAGVFKDPDEREWIIVAADGGVYRTREDNLSAVVALPAGVTIDGAVFFVQAMGDFIMFRGEDLAPLRMTSVDEGFAVIGVAENTVSGSGTENPYDGTATIPNARMALYAGNRLFIPYARDLMAVSDYLNYTRYQPTLGAARINQGSPDKLVALFKFNEDTIIAGKEQSLYVVTGVRGDLSNMSLDEVTREYGVKAVRSFAQVGSDVWFLADRRGVCSIRQTELNKLQAVDLPVSYPIQPLIERINWQYADRATAAWFDNKYYLAVPLDNAEVVRGNIIAALSYVGGGVVNVNVKRGRTYRWAPGAHETSLENGSETWTTAGDLVAQGDTVVLHGSGTMTGTLQPVFIGVNTAVLVYDFLTQMWAGYDTGSDEQGQTIMVREWLKHTYNGVRRLFALTEDGFINLYEEGWEDQVADAIDQVVTVPVADSVTTRGYVCGTIAPKRFVQAETGVGTWSPSLTLKAVQDGVNENAVLKGPITKSRTAYYKPFDKAPYTITNVNGDHGTKHRQDYSVALADGSASVAFGASGVDPQLTQQSLERVRAPGLGKYLQLQVEGTCGRSELRSVEVSAEAGPRTLGTKV